MLRILALFLLFLMACTSENELIPTPYESTLPVDWTLEDIVEAQVPPTDVFLVLDNSCSMQADWPLLTYGIIRVGLDLELAQSDWQLALTSTDETDEVFITLDSMLNNQHEDPGWAIAEALTVFQEESSWGERGFASALQKYQDNQNWFRPEAISLIVFVSDEEEQSEGIAPEQFLRRWPGDQLVLSIVGTNTEIIPNPIEDCIADGSGYLEASDFTLDICSSSPWTIINYLPEG